MKSSDGLDVSRNIFNVVRNCYLINVIDTCSQLILYGCWGIHVIIQIMQFSEIIPQTAHCKFAPNSSYFIYYESTKKNVYVKESSVNLNNFSVIHLNATPSDIAISPDSQLLAVFFKQKSAIYVYRAKGDLVAKIEDTQSGFSWFVWTPSSFSIIAFSETLSKCTIYNLLDKSSTIIRFPKLSSSKGCIFSSNGRLMALLERHDCKDAINIYFCGDWKLMNSIPLQSYDIAEIKWDLNDTHIVAWENPIDYVLFAVCPFKGVVCRYQPYKYALGIKTVEYSKQSFFVAVGSFDEKIRLIHASTWNLIGQLDCQNPIVTGKQTKIYKEDDNSMSNNRMKLVDKNQYKIPITKPVNSEKSMPAQGIGLLQFSHDDRYIACRNDNMPFTVWIWNVPQLQVQTVISLSSHVKMIKWDKFENTLCIACASNKVLFWKDGIILECLFTATLKFNIQRFLWSEDCKRMLLFDSKDCIYVDLVNNRDLM